MKLTIENHFREKVMEQSFGEVFVVTSAKDVQMWKQAWMDGLKPWHSPYKLLLDCSKLEYRPENGEVRATLDRMIKFFQGFFLRKIVAFGLDPNKGHGDLPFEIENSEDEAREKVGLDRQNGPKKVDAADFRSLITIENDFRGHLVEVTFERPIEIAKVDEILILKSKLTNNLMQWHSHWNLLIDCNNLKVGPEMTLHFEQMLRFFQGFFMKSALGYNPKDTNLVYPFPVYRSRHKAVDTLADIKAPSGDAATCASQKIPVKGSHKG